MTRDVVLVEGVPGRGLAATGCCPECGWSAPVGFVVLWVVAAHCAIVMFAFMLVASLCICVCMYHDESAFGVLSFSFVCFVPSSASVSWGCRK